jgi:4-alpha-glucanotransferase
MHGEWVKAPGSALFRKLRQELTGLSLIAEDLGLITAEVTNLREEFAMPGMRILQFGFGDRGAHAYLPHRFVENTVVYTGTHDNNTTVGWWQEDATEIERVAVQAAFRPGDDGIAWTMIRVASTSVAALCLFPLQDVLDLGGEARMNTPSRPDGNWGWRYAENALQPYLAAKLAALTTVADRDAEANELP